MKRSVIHSLGRLLLAILLAAPLLSRAAGEPNVLFIFADDMCYEAVGAMGLTDIDTPNLDRLMKRGTTFTRAYNMGSWSGAVCVASRHMLITGRYIWRAQAASNLLGSNKADAAAKQKEFDGLWPQVLKRQGYQTFFTGKWHIRASAEKAFEVARHVRPGMPRQNAEGRRVGYNRPLPGKPDVWSPSDKKYGGFWEGGKHWSEIVADDAVDFLGMSAKDKRPFFMYIAFNAPHDPRQAPKEYVDRYPLKRIALPKNFLPQYPYKDQIGNPHRLRDERLGPMPRTEHSVKVHRREYYAIIEHLDAQIGRILDTLDKSGQADNTYIFFSADHGLAVGHHGLFGKQNLYEHSTRVPFIAVGPRIAAGVKIDAPIYLQDVHPTTIELAGAKPADKVEFHSLLPMLRGKTKKHAYDAIHGAYLGLQRSVTVDGWKLILYPAVNKARLYNINADPLEMNDLAHDAKQEKRINALFARMLKLQKEMDDKLDLKKSFPKL